MFDQPVRAAARKQLDALSLAARVVVDGGDKRGPGGRAADPHVELVGSLLGVGDDHIDDDLFGGGA